MPILSGATGYGLRPSHMVGGGAYTGAFETFALGSVATGTLLARGHLVVVSSAGAFSSTAGTGLTANTGAVMGVLEGVEYEDASTGDYIIGTYLPTAATSSTHPNCKLRIITDPNVVYTALANNTLLKACVSSSGAQTSIGAHCSLDAVTATGTSIMSTAQGLATTAASASTIALKICGVPQDIVEEALVATNYAHASWVGDILVRINPTVHIYSAATGIN